MERNLYDPTKPFEERIRSPPSLKKVDDGIITFYDLFKPF